MSNKIRSSLFLKMFLSIALILSLSSITIYVIVMKTIPQSYKMEIDQRFSKRYDELVKKLRTVTRKEANALLVDFSIQNSVTIELQTNDKLKNSEEDVLLSKKIQDEESGENQKKSMGLGATVKFTDSDKMYTLITTPVMKVADEITETFWKLLPWILLLILFISSISSLLCSRLLAKPVIELSRISKRMMAMDMTWNCNIKRHDELGVLGKSLNTMAQNLNMAMLELQSANDKLQIDIEKEREQEKQRRIFFAAVSHELKTPITILKGQIESMIDNIGKYKNRDAYLPVSLATVNRMETLVQELLTISKLSAEGFHLHTLRSDVSTVIETCVENLMPLINRKHMVISQMDLQIVLKDIDQKLFEKACANIISNAVLYSPQHAKLFITLDAEKLTVINTDVQIPVEKLPELFSPLTRVEDSRSKDTGGSGLGLYIANTILKLHGFTCKIENIENGVRFTLYLNQN